MAPKRPNSDENMTTVQSTTYKYCSAEAAHTHAYLWQPLLAELMDHNVRRIFDLGCGNGALARFLSGQGIDVVGVDPSETGISMARAANPDLRLEVGSAYDDLRARYGTFSAVVSLEVVEHVYYPRKYAACVHDLLEPGGVTFISTPYHSYWKNLALAIFGKMDDHFTALWDHGHIKFWSPRTIGILLAEQGLKIRRIHRVGRIPTFAKSMLVIAQK